MRLKDLNVISKVFKAWFQYIHFHCEGEKQNLRDVSSCLHYLV